MLLLNKSVCFDSHYFLPIYIVLFFGILVPPNNLGFYLLIINAIILCSDHLLRFTYTFMICFDHHSSISLFPFWFSFLPKVLYCSSTGDKHPVFFFSYMSSFHLLSRWKFTLVHHSRWSYFQSELCSTISLAAGFGSFCWKSPLVCLLFGWCVWIVEED